MMGTIPAGMLVDVYQASGSQYLFRVRYGTWGRMAITVTNAAEDAWNIIQKRTARQSPRCIIRSHCTNSSITSGNNQVQNITAISGCAVVQPPLPRLARIPIACVLLIHKDGVSVELVILIVWINASRTAS